MLRGLQEELGADAAHSDLRAMMLRQEVKIEPLVDRWYAWTHLLWPVQAALNLAYRYIPIAQSFVSAPAVHVAAANDPSMFGGPFMDLPADAAEAVSDYLADVSRERHEALEFARVYREFDLFLQSQATGYSLNEIREGLPPQLKGRVELSYDCHNHPRIRLLDEMFVADDLGSGRAQGVLLNTQKDVERPFFLSTPRLSVPGALYLERPLGSAGIRRLCEARDQPIDLISLAADVGAPVERLLPFFEPDSRRDKPAYTPPREGVRVRYFGHACVLIETPSTTILVDPTFAFDPIDDLAHLTFDDLPERIDVIFISHGHQDHFLPEVLMQLRHRVGAIIVPPNHLGELADPPLKRILTGLGYSNIVVLDPLDTFALPDGKIISLPFSGEHCDLDVHAKQCAIFELRDRKICLFVDSDAIDIDVYRRLAPMIDDPDLMLVGMECNGAPLSWLYGPLISGAISKRVDGSRRLSGADNARAWRLAREIRPKRAYVYAMGQEAWMKYLMGLNYTPDSIQLLESSAFVDNCKADGLESGRFHNFAELNL